MLEIIEPFFQKWKRNYTFRTVVGSIPSFALTVLFALYNGFLGLLLPSVWHGSICVFYLLLAVIRGMILLTERNNRIRGEREKSLYRRRTFLISGIMLLGLNLALIRPISLMVLLEKPVSMGMIPAISVAAYTTCKIVMASIHIRRQKRSHNRHILVTQLRTINLIDALVSILTLQNTLIMVKRTESGNRDMLLLSAVSSAVIYLAIVWITLRLLINGVQERWK